MAKRKKVTIEDGIDKYLDINKIIKAIDYINNDSKYEFYIDISFDKYFDEKNNEAYALKGEIGSGKISGIYYSRVNDILNNGETIEQTTNRFIKYIKLQPRQYNIFIQSEKERLKRKINNK